MAPINREIPGGQQAWNEAYERLVDYLNTFALSDRAQISRLAVDLVDQVHGLYSADSTQDPTTLTIKEVQKRVEEWLRINLGQQELPASQIVSSGSIALLLSNISRSAPKTFLATPLPEDIRQSMRQTLLTTGPDMNVSSMTPRHLDYGPMLDLARQTWHRWDGKSIAIALAFWAGVYVVLYWGITTLL